MPVLPSNRNFSYVTTFDTKGRLKTKQKQLKKLGTLRKNETEAL